MANIIQRYPLNIVPNYWVINPVFLNQRDEGMTILQFPIYSMETRVDLSGMSVVINGKKTDGSTYTYSCGIASDPERKEGEPDCKVAYISVQDQMSISALNSVAELIISDTSGNVVHTANFPVYVEVSPTEGASEPSSDEITVFQELLLRAQEVAASVETSAETITEGINTAVSSAESASANAEAAVNAAQSAEDSKDTVENLYGQMRYQMENEVEARTNADAVLNSRIDALIEGGPSIDEDTELRDLRIGANGVTYTTAGNAVRTQITELQGELDNKYDELKYQFDTFSIDPDDLGLYQDPESGYVYPTYKGERSENGIPLAASGGGGGGGGGDINKAVLTVTNTTGWLSNTIASGTPCHITLDWSSIEDDLSTGNGTVRITVGGAVRASYEVAQGEIDVEVSQYLSAGNNAVKIRVSDVYDNARTITFNITVVQISISSTFDVTIPYTGLIPFTYTLEGAVTKTVYFILDGQTIGTLETSVYGREMTYSIPQQTHGSHVFECYFSAMIDGEPVESNHLVYNFMSVVEGNNTIIITSQFSKTEVEQYDTVQIPYLVYNPAAETSEVEITANSEVVANITVNATTQIFSYRANDSGTLTIVISSGTTSKTFELTVTESSIDVEAETENLALYLTAQGRNNAEENPNQWKYGNIEASMTGFNYTSDGWVQDEDGITVLRVAGNARVSIPYQPFATDFRASGKTIEIEFATRDVLNYDSTVLSCISGGRGITITAQKATLNSEQSSIMTQYKENDHARISFVVTKRSANRLLYIYINGIASGVVQYPDNDDFSQISPVNISIGSNDCTVDIYCIRIYDNDLNRYQIINNWIADTQVGSEMLDRFKRNNVYDAYGQVVISQLPSDLPYMVINATQLPQFKGDKKTVSGSYTDPINPSRSFTFTGAQADVQGTSSQFYPRKNYKFKFKGGFLMSNGALAAKYAMDANSIPTDTFTFKADMASSEGANNVILARLYNDVCTARAYATPAQVANSKVRQGIDGHAMVIFWNNGTQTTFLGKQKLLK